MLIGFVFVVFIFKVVFVVEDVLELLIEFVKKLLEINFSGGGRELVERVWVVFIGLGILMVVSLGFMGVKK